MTALRTLEADQAPQGNRHAVSWTAERVTDAICAWAETYGAPPTSTEWEVGKPAKYAQAALEKASAWQNKAAQFAQGTYPSNDTVRRFFGTFSAAVEAAGFTARPEGRTPREITDRQKAELRIRMKGDTAGPDQLAAQLRGVMRARAAGDGESLRGALMDLAAIALAWAERIGAAA